MHVSPYFCTFPYPRHHHPCAICFICSHFHISVTASLISSQHYSYGHSVTQVVMLSQTQMQSLQYGPSLPYNHSHGHSITCIIMLFLVLSQHYSYGHSITQAVTLSQMWMQSLQHGPSLPYNHALWFAHGKQLIGELIWQFQVIGSLVWSQHHACGHTSTPNSFVLTDPLALYPDSA